MIVYADGLRIQAAVLIDISNITELNSNSERKAVLWHRKDQN